ncbi:hypothetical protein K503DRAFT_772358 [Rhizopogon vinicolor AM-OR11-026]|uniref:Uncharacterized protein n=1 Tax=Rhizopogon vinicolor AM-OR11-026 TaxID=1314800 RepID=A0A1B7MVH1_9AGAM|nr:hypothetical protein K503DRAFT_772358 [Rhizopogon vinicolor AM-OR11-026]
MTPAFIRAEREVLDLGGAIAIAILPLPADGASIVKLDLHDSPTHAPGTIVIMICCMLLRCLYFLQSPFHSDTKDLHLWVTCPRFDFVPYDIRQQYNHICTYQDQLDVCISGTSAHPSPVCTGSTGSCSRASAF